MKVLAPKPGSFGKGVKKEKPVSHGYKTMIGSPCHFPQMAQPTQIIIDDQIASALLLLFSPINFNFGKLKVKKKCVFNFLQIEHNLVLTRK